MTGDLKDRLRTHHNRVQAQTRRLEAIRDRLARVLAARAAAFRELLYGPPRCATCGELPFDGTLPDWHEELPTCTDCGGPLLALWPID